MTLRIERLEGRVRLSGEFRIACVDQVKAEIEKCKSPGALDLEEVALIDLEGGIDLSADGYEIAETARDGEPHGDRDDQDHRIPQRESSRSDRPHRAVPDGLEGG